MVKFDIPSLLELAKKERRHSYYTFSDRMEMTENIYNKVNELKLDDNIIGEIRKNCVVSLVTTLEVLYKDIIVERSGKWNKEGIDFLMKEKNITLKEAFELARQPEIKEEHIIAKSYNFQNWSVVVLVFSKLIGEDIIKGLKAFGEVFSKDEPQGTLRDIPKFITNMEEMLNARHEIIHNGHSNITDDDYQKYWRITVDFGHQLPMYITLRPHMVKKKKNLVKPSQ